MPDPVTDPIPDPITDPVTGFLIPSSWLELCQDPQFCGDPQRAVGAALDASF